MKTKLFIFCFICYSKVIAQQSTLNGVVSIHNSETLTGKREYVTGALVYDTLKKVQQDVTKKGGVFRLIYLGIEEKSTVNFHVKKAGYDVVNIDALKAVTGQYDTVNISMARPDKIAEYRRKLYNVDKTEREKQLEIDIRRYKSELAAQKQQINRDEGKIRKLESELANREEQRKTVSSDAEELSSKYSSINLDDAPPLFRKAFVLFQNGYLDSALQLLDAENLSASVDSVLSQRKKILIDRSELDLIDPLKVKAYEKSRVKYEKQADQLKMVLQLKTDLHRIRYDFTGVAASYELLIKLDPLNPRRLTDYANFLDRFLRSDDAIKYYLMALEAYQRLSRNNPFAYQSDMGDIYEKLSSSYFNDDFNKAEEAYQAALKIRKEIAKTNPQRYDPVVALMQFNFASRCELKDLVKAEVIYSEALEIYQRLEQNYPRRYDQFVLLVQGALGRLYLKLGNFKKGEAMLLQELELRRRLARVDPKTYQPSLVIILSNLGILYHDNNEYEKSERAYLEELELEKHLKTISTYNYDETIANTYRNLGTLYKSMKNLVKAEQSYSEALKIYKNAANSDLERLIIYIEMIQEALAGIYLEYKDYKKAELSYIDVLDCRIKRLSGLPVNSQGIVYATADRLLDIYLSVLKEPDYTYIKLDQFKFETIESKLSKLAKDRKGIAQKLSGIYAIYTWYSLLQLKFKKAEESARKGLQIDSTDINLQIKLAHALLFQGKIDDALKIYQIIKPLKNTKNEFYALICLDDLDELERNGITTKDINRVRIFLKE